MADLTPFPIDEVISMATQSGFTLDELRSPTFTDGLLAAKMSEFRAGTLGQIVNPGQGTRSTTDVFLNTFVSGVGEDVTKIGVGIAEGTRAAAEAAVRLPAQLLAAGPLIIGVAVVAAVVILTAKVG